MGSLCGMLCGTTLEAAAKEISENSAGGVAPEQEPSIGIRRMKEAAMFLGRPVAPS
jgi:hypothetical protein